MDRMIYTAMTGAKNILEQQATTAHNLANVSSNGFRAQIDAFRAVPVLSEGLPTRAFVVDNEVGSDFTPGPLHETGRELDVAIPGAGWLAVARGNGSEAYTRNGSLRINENGMLQTESGLNVLGDGGPISVPPNTTVSIAKDGTVSAIASNNTPPAVIGRLKLVNPPQDSLLRGADGLFQTRNGQAAESDATVTVVSGAVEGSNVNVIEAMVNMISLARQFEAQMKLLQNAENNANKAGQLLSLT
ncbi:flagellar basal-body rod protein FlgF [Methylobacillus flagellatus]|uniref:flagellar basal-body rod protein FlgF n=1 Tax=Methylobacillus flagellatus TaxID=405 RepID=UPI0010F7D363|nr:flagellar basal-body rod protein FlgF [Methylobacillus flagellatus]